MKIQTLVLLMLSAAATYAQNEVEVRYANPEWEVYKTKPQGENHTVSIYLKKGKGSRLDEQFSFNQKGLIDREISYKRFGHPKKETRYTYNDSDKVTSRMVIQNDKFRYMYRHEYTNLTLISSAKHFYKDTTEPTSTTTYEYVMGNKIKSITATNNKKQKVVYRYEYGYNEQGVRTESRFYKKGKLKHAWVYNCDIKGEQVESKTVKICKNRSYAADSSFTEIYESTKKGKVTRTIVKSAADGRVLAHELYDAKGSLKSKSVYEYNASNKLVKLSRFDGKKNQPYAIEQYEYGSDSRLTASVHLDKKGEVTSRREFQYN